MFATDDLVKLIPKHSNRSLNNAMYFSKKKLLLFRYNHRQFGNLLSLNKTRQNETEQNPF